MPVSCEQLDIQYRHKVIYYEILHHHVLFKGKLHYTHVVAAYLIKYSRLDYVIVFVVGCTVCVILEFSVCSRIICNHVRVRQVN